MNLNDFKINYFFGFISYVKKEKEVLLSFFDLNLVFLQKTYTFVE